MKKINAMNACFRKMTLKPENGFYDVSLSFHHHLFRITVAYYILPDVEYYGVSET